jgi:hypothetical protein
MISFPKTSPPNPVFRWLSLAGWGFVALAYLTFFLLDLQLDYAQTLVPCSGEACNYLAISQAEFDVLEDWGLTSRFYARTINGATLIGVAGCWLLAGLILWRQGGTRIGWTVSLILAIISITLISDANNVVANHPALEVPAYLLSIVGTMILLSFLYLFPSGRFYPRWAYIPLALTIMLFIALSAVYDQLISAPAQFEQFGPVLLLGALLLIGVFQILRYQRDSTPAERQQTKWLLFGVLLLLLGFPIWFLIFGGLVDIPAGQPRLLASLGGWLTNMLLTISLPVSMAIAISRYRLWDIDLVIRRTLQYALLTGILALTYFGGIVILQGILSSITGSENSPLATVITTLAIAALFNPIRIRIQDFIDRRFFRKKYNAEQALAQFAAIARDEVEMDKLTAALLAVVEETVQPENLTLMIRKEGK